MIEIFADCSYRHSRHRCSYTVYDTHYRTFYTTKESHKFFTDGSAVGELKAIYNAVEHMIKMIELNVDDHFIIYNDDITNVRVLQENNMILMANRGLQYQFLAALIMTIVNEHKKKGIIISFRYTNRRQHEEMRLVDNISFYHLKNKSLKFALIGAKVPHNGIVIC